MLNFLDTPATQSPTQTPKVSELTPKEFLLGIAKRIKDEGESERSRINAQTIIQMCRRHRNMTPGDAFGFWSNSVWREHPSFSKLHNIPVFQQLVIGAESNFAQVDIRLNVEAVSNTFENRSVEKIAKDIYEILDEQQWNETARSSAFYAAILMQNAFYISRFNKDKGTQIPVPEFDDVSYEKGGTAICPNCYATSDFASNTEQTCEECGSENLSILNDPEQVEDQLVSSFSMTQTGEAEMIVATGLDVTVDPNGKPADVESCGWLEWRVDAQKAELQRLYPHLKLEGAPVWSYQKRLKKALQRFQSGETTSMTERDKTEYEVRNIWLDVTEYEEYCAPEDWKLADKVIIKRGEYFKDKYPDGMILGLPSPVEIAFIDKENKNKRVSSSLWVSDGGSFEGLGAKAGLPIQRSINQLANIIHEGVNRSMTGAVIYNPEAVDGSQLEGANANIPLRSDFSLAQGDLKQHVMPLNVSGLDPATLELINIKKREMQEAMGIPDVLIGQDTAEDPTYGGQALRSRNALGLLTPKTLSMARAKEKWLGHQLDIIKTYYSPESLKQFGGRENEWLDDEVDAFFDADLSKAITIQYVPGTEVPESRFDKQMRLRQDIVGQIIPMTPELQSRLARESNYDAPDINNFESNLRLAEKRFKSLKETIEQGNLDQQYQQAEAQMIGPDGQRAMDQTGAPVPNPIVQQIVGAIPVYSDVEDHGQMASFWAAKVRNIAASSNESPALLAACDAMVQKHNESQFRNDVVQQGKMGTAAAVGQAPAAMGQHMLQQQGAEHAASLQQPPPPEVVPSPKQKVIENINFKDLPSSGQVQLAREAGINITEDDVNKHLASQKPAAKPAAKQTRLGA